jgi:prepilin-type processing-associated H-X9-DG protein
LDQTLRSQAAGDDTDAQQPPAEESPEPDADTAPDAVAARPILNGVPMTATAIGGFESQHPGGANFALGDGAVKFVADTINMKVLQQLGHRADGQLLTEEF